MSHNNALRLQYRSQKETATISIVETRLFLTKTKRIPQFRMNPENGKLDKSVEFHYECPPVEERSWMVDLLLAAGYRDHKEDFGENRKCETNEKQHKTPRIKIRLSVAGKSNKRKDK